MIRVAWWTCTLLGLAGARIYERCELARDLMTLGVDHDDISTWVCIAYHESRFDTAANNPHSGDHGLFQISELYWCGGGKACALPCSALRDDDISDDLRCALKVHEEHTRLQGNGYLAWVVYPQHCKHNTKKYVVDCDYQSKSYTGVSQLRSFSNYYDSSLNNSNTTYTKVDDLLPPYLTIGTILRGNYGKVTEKSRGNVDWYNYKYDDVDKLKLPVLGQKTETASLPTTTTTTSTTIFVPPVKPWRTIETNQFRNKIRLEEKTTTLATPKTTTLEITTTQSTTHLPETTKFTTPLPITTVTTSTHILPNVTTTTSSYTSAISTPRISNTSSSTLNSPLFTTTYKPPTASTSVYKFPAFSYFSTSKPTVITTTTVKPPSTTTSTYTLPTISSATYRTTVRTSTSPWTLKPFFTTSTTTHRPQTTKYVPFTFTRPTLSTTTTNSFTTKTTAQPFKFTTASTTTKGTEIDEKKARQSVFDLYLRPTTRPKLPTYHFPSNEDSRFKLNIFSSGTTTPRPVNVTTSAPKIPFGGALRNHFRRQTFNETQ